jgi:hypothetical protein
MEVTASLVLTDGGGSAGAFERFRVASIKILQFATISQVLILRLPEFLGGSRGQQVT